MIQHISKISIISLKCIPHSENIYTKSMRIFIVQRAHYSKLTKQAENGNSRVITVTSPGATLFYVHFTLKVRQRQHATCHTSTQRAKNCLVAARSSSWSHAAVWISKNRFLNGGGPSSWKLFSLHGYGALSMLYYYADVYDVFLIHTHNNS